MIFYILCIIVIYPEAVHTSINQISCESKVNISLGSITCTTI